MILANGVFAGQCAWLGKTGMPGSTYDNYTAELRLMNPFVGGPYSVSAQVPMAHCPSDGDSTIAGMSAYDYGGHSYAANVENGTHRSLMLPNSDYGIRTAMIRSPSRMIVFAESGAYWSALLGTMPATIDFYWHDKLQPKWGMSLADGHGAMQTVPFNAVSGDDYSFDRDQ